MEREKFSLSSSARLWTSIKHKLFIQQAAEEKHDNSAKF